LKVRSDSLLVAVVVALILAGSLSLGVVSASEAIMATWMDAEIVYDLVEEFGSAEIANAAESSVGDVQGNERMNHALLKRCIFLHPPSGEVTAATATYSLRLPRPGREERVLLLFAVGLRPGWRDAANPNADGVIFRVLVEGEKIYEQPWDRDGWCYAAIDLTEHSGKKIRLTLVCDRNQNNSADWALWGDPRIILLRGASRPRRDASQQPSLFVFRVLSSEEITAEWPALGEKGTGVVRSIEDTSRKGLAWFPVPPGSLRLPRMKLASGAEPALEDVVAVSYTPEIELVSAGHSPAVVTPDEPFRVIVTLKNVGEGALSRDHAFKIRLGVPTQFQLAEGDTPEREVGAMQPSDERLIFWRLISPSETGRFRFGLTVGLVGLKSFEVVVSPAGKGIQYGFISPEPSGFHEKKEFVLLDKGDKRLAFIREDGRFLYGTILLKMDERWRSVGHLAPFGDLSIKLRNGEVQKIEIQPSRHERLNTFAATPLTDEELAICFTEQFEDDDSVGWTFTQSFKLAKESPWAEVETTVVADAPREVALFIAPRLLAGDGVKDFGASKDQALFPGLEYLGKDDPSSSTRDISAPQNRRFTPHPLRVTIPLMAVREGSALIGLSWDTHQKWHLQREMPMPIFSSPNWFPSQDNHLMAIGAPTVPEFINEGTLDNKRTVSVAAGEPLTLNASILLKADATDITDAAVAWVQRHGLPDAKCPRDLEKEMELCRHGFLHSVWNDSAEGWSHCVGWEAGPYPGYCTLLNMDYFLSGDDEIRRTLRERVDLVVRKCLEKLGPGSLWRADGCHILMGEVPFLEGHVLECVENWTRATDNVLGMQSPDGSFRWRPDAKRASLGKPGDTTSGMCARGADRILRAALVTGNGEHIKAGLKALEFMDKYTIPTGAQEWECPIYAPDVLAAAYAVGAFVRAYEITGDDRHLEKARFWARTGIPFHYLWDRGDDMPQMRYAGIPIFGATFYTHSWLGRPVQWCSLVYAYAVIRLSRYDSSFDWRRLAEGITVSAMWQQYTEGKNKGCYPDSWELLENHPNPADINPEDILVNLLALNGYDPCLKHKVLKEKGNSIFITSIAEILSAGTDDKGSINLRMKFFSGAKTYVLLAGLSSSLKPEVFVNGKPLASTEDVDHVPAGWLYDRRKGWLVIGLTHSPGEDNVQIRLRSSGQ
jgi:hypothetical protein